MSTDPRNQQPVTSSISIGEEKSGITKLGANPSITDAYADVLRVLSPRQRRGLIAQLAVGFYDGWRPGRAEVTDLVAVKKGIMTADECEQRRLLRNNGHPVPDIDVFSTPRPTDLQRPVRYQMPRRLRDHRGQWTKHNPPGTVPHSDALHERKSMNNS